YYIFYFILLFLLSIHMLFGKDFPLSNPGDMKGIYNEEVENSVGTGIKGDGYKSGNSEFIEDAEINEEQIQIGIGEDTEEASGMKDGWPILILASLVYGVVIKFRNTKKT
ncbi:MAG: hypothetical protein LIO93_06885, partial [Bacteroidales bacterium]|nr:hypothetical protein [Bacteroidales bacterium]